MMTALNAVCPYFTMFPLSFPLGLLQRHSVSTDVVLDPFVGRGTTLYAARVSGLAAHGIDSNPVAVAISEAKLANTTPARILGAANRILRDFKPPTQVPDNDFWHLAFHEEVLTTLCHLRAGLIANCNSDARKGLRAIILGALHGPLGKHQQSYFSNQCPRTYAPKPGYAIRFWQKNRLAPPKANVMQIIERRAERYYATEKTFGTGGVVAGDSQKAHSFHGVSKRATWIVTSPPYYGMRTYIPDQWLRRWFVGGRSIVDYSNTGQLAHGSQEEFCEGLRTVWVNCAAAAAEGCRLVIRFGAINDRKVDPRALLKKSLQKTNWRLLTSKPAGTAASGRRQVDQFSSAGSPIEEYDFWAEIQSATS
ncbi:MAG TPA: DNA methyltransferase [Chthoniobacterales bacterium]|nr:DNA methyltransferase [Chthoniobacterales bacterium]